MSNLYDIPFKIDLVVNEIGKMSELKLNRNEANEDW